jgi:hypothetical protein
MREGNPAEGSVAKRVASSRLPIQSKKEARLWVNECVAKSIHHDASDVAFGIEPGSREHLGHLLANLAFIVDEGSG